MEENAYTIAPSARHKFHKWVNYLGILLVLAYLYLMADVYLESGWNSESMINLGIAVVYSATIYLNLTSNTQPSMISLSDEGITIEGDDQQNINWSALQQIRITNNALFFDFKDDSQRECLIDLKYNELQEAKKHLRSFCQQHDLTFSSKY
jgi:hypothetical protein